MADIITLPSAPQSDIEIEVVPDGTPTEVSLVEEEQVGPQGHAANLALVMEDDELAEISKDLLEAFEADDESRSEWIETYKKGLDLLGFKMEERSKPFKGASGVFHPLLAEAVVRFQSNSIMEIFPASGPVLTKILGDPSPEKIKQSQRVKEELNYQLTEKMTEYRSEKEQLLFRLPLAGSVFKKVYFDPLKKRPTAIMVTAEDFVIDYYASELSTSERYTHVMRRSANEVKKLQRVGLYRQVDLPKPVQKNSEGREKEDELQGREKPVNNDERHCLLEMHVHINLPGPFADPDGIADPYIITIDKDSGTVLSVYRNWREDDDQDRKAEIFFVHYPYMPGLGFYGFGLIHLVGSVAKASTSILRQLIDAGTLANLPGGLKTRGLRTKHEDKPIQPGEWRDVDAPPGALKENLFTLPYKEPSATLVALLDKLVDEGRRIGSIADVQVGTTAENAPVGTTIAILERSLKVMTAVHARLHAALKKELKLIARVIADYMPPQYDWDESGQFNRAEDFDGRVDIVPVSDPNAATQAQRIVQLQAVQQLAQSAPEIYNMKELHRSALQAIGIKDDERLLPMDIPPPRLDPVSENMAVMTQQPIKVYPEQDHTAHIQAHLSYLNDPKIMELVGQSPNFPMFQGAMEAHIAEHLAHQYRAEMEQKLGQQLPELGEELPPDVEASLSRMVAESAVALRNEHQAVADAKEAEELMNDPEFQIKAREVAVKERKLDHDIKSDNFDNMVDVAKKAADEALKLREIQSRENIAAAEIGANLVTFGVDAEKEEREQGVKLGKEIAENLRKDAMDQDKLSMEAVDRQLDRKARLQEAREKLKAEAEQKAKDRQSNKGSKE